MKKEALRRGLLGAPIGIALGHIITIIISLVYGDGALHPVVPALTAQFGSEISAVVVQMILCAVLGAIQAAASVIWDMDNWSVFKQTGTHFCILSVTLLPIAYFTHWMERSVGGFFLYFGIFLLLFIVAWVMQYFVWKTRVKKLNDKISEGR